MRRHQALAFSKKGKQCLYIMHKSFRIVNNYSLYEAIQYANKQQLALHILIVVPDEINNQSLLFFKQQTTDLKAQCLKVTHNVDDVTHQTWSNALSDDIEAIFMDQAYLREDLLFYKQVYAYAKQHQMTLFQVESNVFVPVRVVSEKEEYGAYTLRPKIKRMLDQYDQQVLVNQNYSIGEKNALHVLEKFIKQLSNYHLHNDPSFAYTSRLSVYLKYGMISPVTIYDRLKDIAHENKDQFLEELIIRRELAYNYVYYNPAYDKFERMTERWAYMTMHDHEHDAKAHIYTIDDYVQFKTHDPYFNAAMKQMVYTGYMHGYMRMYWAKQIILWSQSFEEAYHTLITLNNRYFLDGLTPNGYAGVAWCFGKHDRAWKDRPIIGKLRYMNANGLKRKFHIEDYVLQMEQIEKENR